jgi:hypothetical protein
MSFESSGDVIRRKLPWSEIFTFLLSLGAIACVILLTATVHHNLPPTQPKPSGWIRGEVNSRYVVKPAPLYYSDPTRTFRRSQQHLYDLIDGRDDTTFTHSLLAVITLGSASLTSGPLVNIQPAFIAGHRHAVVCDQGTIVSVSGKTFTLRNGFQTSHTLFPTGCLTHSDGYEVTAYPEIFAELPDMPVSETTWTFYIIVTLLAMCAYKISPFITTAIITITAAYMAVWALLYGFFAASVLLTAFLLFRLRTRIVTVYSDPSPFKINELKDRFRKIKNTKTGKIGEHLICAHWRRLIEKEVANCFRERGIKYRDVGGSRSRYPEDSDIKHICSAQNDNDDILREDKSTGVFENCYCKGQNCPKRFTLRGALLSHVDYHVEPSDLADIITGPTFIVNHLFGPAGTQGGYGLIDNDGDVTHEAKWVNNGGVITMTTHDGTPYNHSYNDWQTEGTIMGRCSAATYVRIANYKDCCVYYAYPSCGDYDRANPRVLTRSTPADMTLNDGTNIILRTERLGDRLVNQFVYETKDGPITVPAHIPPSIAFAMAPCPRNENYEQQLSSLTAAKLRGHSQTIEAHAIYVKAHARKLADVYAKEMVSNSSLHGWDPNSDGYIRTKAFELVNWLRFSNLTYQRIANDVLNSPMVLPVAKVIGVVVKVPTSEVFAELTIAEISKATKHGQSFRGEPTPVDAGSDVGAEHSAEQVSDECDSLVGEESAESSGNAEPVDHGSLDQLQFGDFPCMGELPTVDQPGCSTTEFGSHINGEESANRCGHGQRTETLAQQQASGTSSVAPACTNAGFDFARAVQLATSQGKELFTQRIAERRPDETPRHILRMELQEGDTNTTEEFNVSRPLLQVESTAFVSLLQKLPRVPLKNLRCAIRCAVRAVGVSMSSCGHSDHPSDCFNVRVLKIAIDGDLPRAHSRLVICGVGYAIPHGPQAKFVESKGRCVYEGPIPKGCHHRLLPQVGNNNQDDRPPEHQPEIRPDVVDTRAGDFRNRTRHCPAYTKKPKGSKSKRNDNAGKRSGSQRKS